MGHIVGIDLGTTYSAVAVPMDRSDEGFFTTPQCPGYSVVLDRFKRRITPSVVAEDDRGEIVVGYTAKGRAGLAPEPIMFAKRWMGMKKTFQLDKQGTLSPVEASAHILRYLKEMAEQRLGGTVDEAVITVPAYFELMAKQNTEKAGELAGLKVAQIVQEPVAAALMYCASDDRDPLRIMTYDLGGGTFDVAILEKRDGVISTDSIRAFEGDQYLGGYDFDKVLAYWIIDQLNEQGYELQLDENNPADNVVLAKLMIYAERVKIDLSKTPHCEIQEPTTGIRDRAGNDVAIQLELSRDKFEAMIQTQVDYTIQICHRARLEKANPPIEADQFDEILMVGGSSRIPMIGRRLEEAFGIKPRLVEPDLCVALGAAIIAGTKTSTFGCLKLDPLPRETDLPSLTITGRIVSDEKLTDVQGCSVSVRAVDGSYHSNRKVGHEGAFVFKDVPLADERTTEFLLTAQSAAGAEIAQHAFSVKQSASAATGGVIDPGTNLLSKPIGILMVDGIQVIAPERTPLPYHTTVQAKTTDSSGEVRVPIYEENNRLGQIWMKDLPADAPVGTSVEVNVTIDERYQVHGRAFVPALQREETEVINLSVPSIPTKAELLSRYQDLEHQANDALSTAGPGVLFGDAKAKRLKDRLRDCRGMLDGPAADGAKINNALDEVESLVRDLRAGWKPEPPRAVFDQMVSATEALLSRVIRDKPHVADEGYDKRLEAIRAEADGAYNTQSSAAWKLACQNVSKLSDELNALIERPPRGGGDSPQDPNSLLLSLAQRLNELAQQAKQQGRYEKMKQEFKEAADSLKRIDAKAPDAMAQIRDWYFTRLQELEKRLQAPEPTGLLEQDS